MRENIQKRRQQSNLAALLKSGPRTRKQGSGRPVGISVTMTFSGTGEIDEIIDHWAKEWDVGRSYVFRQAILLSDLRWGCEYGSLEDQGQKMAVKGSSRRSGKC